MIRALQLTTVAGGLLVFAACDYTGEFVFPVAYEDVPSVWVLGPEDGGRFLEPAVIENTDDIAANTIYAESGANVTSEIGGVTFEFEGTGGDVCVWVDPETASWNESVNADPVGVQFVSALVRPDGSAVDGMLIFYGWLDPEIPDGVAFLLDESTGETS